MNHIYNSANLKERRRQLRQNQTEAEKKLWFYLRNRRLQQVKFFRQYSVGSFILDFYSPSCKVAIELDGSQHKEVINKIYDERRRKFLEKFGIRVLRFWDNDIFTNTDGVLQVIVQHLA